MIVSLSAMADVVFVLVIVYSFQVMLYISFLKEVQTSLYFPLINIFIFIYLFFIQNTRHSFQSLIKLEYSDRFYKNPGASYFMNIFPVCNELFRECGQTDTQAD